MFSHLSAKRFPEDRTCPTVGPGTYEVPSFLDEASSQQNSFIMGGDREDMPDMSFSIFVDEEPKSPRCLPKQKAPRTPRSARKPFGTSAKENRDTILTSSAKKSLGRHGKAKCDEDLLKQSKVNESSDTERVEELQRMVEEMESYCRAAQRKIEGLEAQKARCQEHVEEAAELRKRLEMSNLEQDYLREQFEAATERAKALETAAVELPADQKGLTKVVQELVAHELANPRKVFCLQQKLWEKQVRQLQEQHDEIEQQVEKRVEQHKRRAEDALARAAEADSKLAAEQAKAADAEFRAVEAECKALAATELEAELTQLRLEVESARSLRAELQRSQLEEQRLREKVAVSEDAMERYRKREAELAGHANHKQKIQLSLKFKKENEALRSEVERLQKENFRLQSQ